MPAKKDKAAAAEEPKAKKSPEEVKAARKADKVAAAEAGWATYAAERALTADRLAAEGASLINAPTKVTADAEGDIDARMAALEADHRKMGAR